MRERLDSRHFYARCIRITPAYAGKTGNTCCDCKSTGDHPRVCGKDRIVRRLISGASRGKAKRITPAYAGKTQRELQKRLKRRDHPRVCGKDKTNIKMIHLNLGSPPRMRERPFTKSIAIKKIRITPAYAGKTQKLENGQAYIEDHPRVCGKDSGDEK